MAENQRWQAGLTLAEMLVAVGVGSLVVAAVSLLVTAAFQLPRREQEQGWITHEAAKVLDRVSDELRGAKNVDLNSNGLIDDTSEQWLQLGDSTTVEFYVFDDRIDETVKVLYFLDGTDFKRQITRLDETTEDATVVASGIRNGEQSQDIFCYLSEPSVSDECLTVPVSAPSTVKLVRMTFVVDANSNQAPTAAEVRTAVHPRGGLTSYSPSITPSPSPSSSPAGCPFSCMNTEACLTNGGTVHQIDTPFPVPCPPGWPNCVYHTGADALQYVCPDSWPTICCEGGESPSPSPSPSPSSEPLCGDDPNTAPYDYCTTEELCLVEEAARDIGVVKGACPSDPSLVCCDRPPACYANWPPSQCLPGHDGDINYDLLLNIRRWKMIKDGTILPLGPKCDYRIPEGYTGEGSLEPGTHWCFEIPSAASNPNNTWGAIEILECLMYWKIGSPGAAATCMNYLNIRNLSGNCQVTINSGTGRLELTCQTPV